MRISPINYSFNSKRFPNTSVVKSNNKNVCNEILSCDKSISPSFKGDNKSILDYAYFPIFSNGSKFEGLAISNKTKNLGHVNVKISDKEVKELFIDEKKEFDTFAFKHFLNIFSENIDEKYNERKALSKGFVLEVTEMKNGEVVKRDEFDKDNMTEVFASVEQQCDIPEAKIFFENLLASSKKEITLSDSEIEFEKEKALNYMRLSKTKDGYNYRDKNSKKMIIFKLGIRNPKNEIKKLLSSSDKATYGRNIDFISDLNDFVMGAKLTQNENYDRPAELLYKYQKESPSNKYMVLSNLTDLASVCSVDSPDFEELYELTLNKVTGEPDYSLLGCVTSIYTISDYWAKNRIENDSEKSEWIASKLYSAERKDVETYYNDAKMEIVRGYLDTVTDKTTGTRVHPYDMISPTEYFNLQRLEYEEVDPTIDYEDGTDE